MEVFVYGFSAVKLTPGYGRGKEGFFVNTIYILYVSISVMYIFFYGILTIQEFNNDLLESFSILFTIFCGFFFQQYK